MNCQRIQSLLSAYIDGELTGEEMIVIRRHVSSCEFCGEELYSLQVVKRLLGSLQSVDADDQWSSNVTTVAFTGNKSWWEKAVTHDLFVMQDSKTPDVAALTPRGVRMVRALALSAAVVFLAAGPFASQDRLERGVTGRIVGSVGIPMLGWSSDQPAKMMPITSLFQSENTGRDTILGANVGQALPQYGVTAASTSPAFVQPAWTSDSSLTFVSANSK